MGTPLARFLGDYYYPMEIGALNMAKSKPEPNAKRKPKVIAPGASGRNGLVPPPEHRWKPGQSGNPKGVQHKDKMKKSLDDILRAAVNDGVIDGQRVADLLVKAGIKYALKGDFRFWDAIFNRVAGKVPERIEAMLTYRFERRMLDTITDGLSPEQMDAVFEVAERINAMPDPDTYPYRADMPVGVPKYQVIDGVEVVTPIDPPPKST